jgi:predicted dehydrogenase
MSSQRSTPSLQNRRSFLKKSSAASVAGLTALHLSFPEKTHAENADTLKVGLIGCGGRGSGAANQALNADKNMVLWSMGEAFEDKLQRSLSSLKEQHKERVNVSQDRQFVGLDAFEKVLNSGVDVVLLATPPGFRPQHLKAAIDAGKHVFCEKPMATDAPGLRSVLESAAKAKQKNLALVAGFCWRYDYARRELFSRILDGEIGDIRSIYATYYTGPVKSMPADETRVPGMTDVEWQVRNWYNFTWLSGDSLAEQAVHSVDKINWAMKDVPPLKCVASGGRQIPNNSGNIFDHFAVYYEYPNDVRAFLGSRQIFNCHNENNDYIYGSKGTGLIKGGRVTINGEDQWRYSGPKNNMYQTEHNELFASIRNGNPINDGEWMATSTMMALMGRMAAYTGREITWEEALNSEERLVPEPLDWNAPLPIRPLSMPGRTPVA